MEHLPEGERTESLMETLSIQELRMHKRIALKLVAKAVELDTPQHIVQGRINAAARFHRRLVERTTA